MELDDMKQTWALINRRLEQQQALNLQMFKDGRMDRITKALRPLWWGQQLQIIAGVCFMLRFAPFWMAHREVPHLVVYGLAMHAFGLMLIATAARNLYLQNRLDYSLPVLEIQRRIATLRHWRLREALMWGVIGCLIWIPGILLAFAELGTDVWVNSPSVVWWNLAASVGCIAVFFGIVGYSRLPGRERFRGALENTAIGRSVLNTQGLIEEIARFERPI